MRILGIPSGVHASACYRTFLPFGCLAESGGHEVNFPVPGCEPDASGHDAVAAHNLAKAAGASLWRSWKGRVPLVWDTDDDLLACDPRVSYEDIDDPFRAAYAEIVSLSDLVTVSTPVLAERMAKLSRNVAVLPNYVDARLLETERPRRERVTVGWGGAAPHAIDVMFAAGPLRRFFARHPQVDLHVMGGSDCRRIWGRPDARFTLWTADVRDYYRQIDFDIGIAPLAPNAYNEARSHLKALEYAALGIPVVASDSPAYRDFVVNGETGYLVRYEHEWAKRLGELAADAAMREEMGQRAKAHAAKYTIQQHWPEWENAYQGVML